MRTTIDMPDEEFRRIKALAALQGMSMKDFIMKTLRKGLREEEEVQPRRRVQFPLIKGSGATITFEMVQNAIDEMNNEEDLHKAGLS